ncbi:hypothetical protein C0Q70_09813 [Pomacea canaliculata]|uniref:Charged multivesicular body protein 3 n=1 Tax=Pomacea canaliculata TaxID=400727 RepID=A0A2T7PAU4_POMCA|nr:hypothetical protein C0Q70_09813 [Pomacea canaliculata]
MGLFGKTNERPPKEMVQEWTHKIRKEGYSLDRQIRNIQREEEKTKRMLKDAAKKGDKDTCRILAKEIVHARKAISRIYASKAHLNSVQLSMKQQLANLRISGALEKSTQVMVSMQQLLKVPEIMATMREMSKEMAKAGILEEMVDDAMESVNDDEELEEAAEGEVDKVLWELTAAIGATAGTSQVAEEDDEEDLESMKARLEALRS